MKGFVRYLDKHQGVQPSPYEYNCLIQSINHNYTQFHVGPPPPAHVLKYDVPIHESDGKIHRCQYYYTSGYIDLD